MVFISCLITSIDFCQKTIGNKRSHTFVHQKKYLNIVQLMFIKIIFNQSKEGGISRLVVARVKYASDIHIKKIN